MQQAIEGILSKGELGLSSRQVFEVGDLVSGQAQIKGDKRAVVGEVLSLTWLKGRTGQDLQYVVVGTENGVVGLPDYKVVCIMRKGEVVAGV